MGLDVYLYRCADRPAAKRAAEQFEAAFEAMRKSEFNDKWGHELSNEVEKKRWEARRAAIAAEYRVDQCGAPLSEEKIELPSTLDADHCFKIGYFRSSYNESGINRVMRNLGLPDLDGIFKAGNQYEFAPDWDSALEAVDVAIAGYETHLGGALGGYAVTQISPMFGHGVDTEQDAMALFKTVLSQQHGPDCRSFSNCDGYFFLDGMKVAAIVTKKFTPPAANDLIGRIINTPSVFVIYEKQPSDGKEDWYVTALKIVRETIQYVLAQPNRGDYYFHWSG